MPPTTEDLRKQWGAAVAARRLECGLSQAKLADAIGVQKETVSRIERGVFGGSDSTRMAIAAALGVEVPELFPWPSTVTEAAS